jgi:hypothetical protein
MKALCPVTRKDNHASCPPGASRLKKDIRNKMLYFSNHNKR